MPLNIKININCLVVLISHFVSLQCYPVNANVMSWIALEKKSTQFCKFRETFSLSFVFSNWTGKSTLKVWEQVYCAVLLGFLLVEILTKLATILNPTVLLELDKSHFWVLIQICYMLSWKSWSQIGFKPFFFFTSQHKQFKICM